MKVYVHLQQTVQEASIVEKEMRIQITGLPTLTMCFIPF